MNCTHLYLFIYLPISEDYSNFLRESRKQFITEIYLYIYTHGSIMCRYTTYKLQNISSFLLNKTTVLYIHLNYFAIFHHFVINLFNKKRCSIFSLYNEILKQRFYALLLLYQKMIREIAL